MLRLERRFLKYRSHGSHRRLMMSFAKAVMVYLFANMFSWASSWNLLSVFSSVENVDSAKRPEYIHETKRSTVSTSSSQSSTEALGASRHFPPLRVRSKKGDASQIGLRWTWKVVLVGPTRRLIIGQFPSLLNGKGHLSECFKDRLCGRSPLTAIWEMSGP